MINKIEISGSNYKVEESIKKYAEKRIGKLDRYLPHGYKKDVVVKVVITEAGKNKSDKYEISAAMEVPGGKVMAARDDCSNIFAGIDLIEAKLLGQIRRYKLDMQPHRQKKTLKSIFKKQK